MGTFFDIQINGQQATVNHLYADNASCTANSPEAGILFEVICVKNDQLATFLYSKDEDQGAIISDDYGIIDTFICQEN